jgi:hypothetical protein
MLTNHFETSLKGTVCLIVPASLACQEQHEENPQQCKPYQETLADRLEWRPGSVAIPLEVANRQWQVEPCRPPTFLPPRFLNPTQKPLKSVFGPNLAKVFV